MLQHANRSVLSLNPLSSPPGVPGVGTPGSGFIEGVGGVGSTVGRIVIGSVGTVVGILVDKVGGSNSEQPNTPSDLSQHLQNSQRVDLESGITLPPSQDSPENLPSTLPLTSTETKVTTQTNPNQIRPTPSPPLVLPHTILNSSNTIIPSETSDTSTSSSAYFPPSDHQTNPRTFLSLGGGSHRFTPRVSRRRRGLIFFALLIVLLFSITLITVSSDHFFFSSSSSSYILNANKRNFWWQELFLQHQSPSSSSENHSIGNFPPFPSSFPSVPYPLTPSIPSDPNPSHHSSNQDPSSTPPLNTPSVITDVSDPTSNLLQTPNVSSMNSLSDKNNQSKIESSECQFSVESRDLTVDSKGFLCQKKDIITNGPNKGCCSSPNPPTPYSCQRCNSTSGCCEEYEVCISCCLSPLQFPSIVSSISSNYSGFKLKVDSWHLCQGICRTSSKSVTNEHLYSSSQHHCYSVNQK